MNKAQKEIELAKLAEEKRQLNTLKAIYNKAAEDVNKSLVITNGKIEIMLSEIDDLDDDTKSVLRSQIYHKNFQEGISRQLNGFLNELNSNQYKSIDEYLNACYETGFIGAAYELADQGIPLIMPIDQKKVVKAITIDSKISKPLYTKLGEDVDLLKKRIANNISRGIAFSDSYDNIARNIRNDSNVGFNKAMRIVRTEGHRVHVESSFDAMKEAQSKGADIVKQWNAQLDGKTRPHHRQLDGQIRELDEPFELNGIKVKYPSAFGRPEEDINCRCVIHQRAKWALDEEELETLKERASFHGLRVNDSKAFGQKKAKDFADFKKKYLVAAEEEWLLKNNLPKGYKEVRNIGEPIKTETLNTFLEEAKKKGIQVGHGSNATGNFETYCGDPKILFEVLEETEKQLQNQHIDSIILIYDNVLGYDDGKGLDKSKIDIGAFAMTQGKTITLNKFMFDDTSHMIKEYIESAEAGFFVKNSTYKNIISHEAGHIISRNARRKKARLYERTLAVLEKEAKDQGIELDEYIVNNISVYATVYDEDNGYFELIPEINSMLASDTDSGVIKLLKKEGVLNED